MDYHLQDGRLFLDRTPVQMKELTQRLNRVEGQVRGIRAMIENGRHCRDELQQINAVTAALREIALIITAQHVAAGVTCAAESPDREVALADLMDIVQVALRRG